jgi:oxygen-independent coproporphyrinogen-3 oxidase
LPGIYIHIPFCKQACHYCNFHFSTSGQYKKEMIDAIVNEIRLTPGLPDNREGLSLAGAENIETLYFGGGTPSMLDNDDLKQIFDALQKRFVFTADIEVTLEANPDDITGIKSAEWRSLGINRLSIGIQSFVEKELKWMNRVHTAKDSLQCIDTIRDAGFTNFSVDLIYGSPLLSDDNWKRNLDIVIEKNIPHISCYALTVEPKTALDKMIALKKTAPVDAEKQARQFLLLMDCMENAGYEHYEISNFAKPGMRSRHNSSYWSQTPAGQNKVYYAFGPSAHSFDGKSRRWNIANNALYLQSLQENTIPFEEETLTAVQQLNEYIMTSLRTMEGLNLNLVKENFGAGFKDQLELGIGKWQAGGKLLLKGSKLILTREGKLFADGIAADLFF